MTVRYEIDKDNAVLIYLGETDEPNTYQPFDPEVVPNRPFTKAEAKAWAEAEVAAINASREAAAAEIAATTADETVTPTES